MAAQYIGGGSVAVHIRSLDPAGDVKPLVTFLACVMRETPTEEALRATLTAPVSLRRLAVITDAHDAPSWGIAALPALLPHRLIRPCCGLPPIRTIANTGSRP